MEKIELYLNEATSLTFGVDIHGTTVTNVLPRLIIDSIHIGTNIAIVGTYEGGKATFDVPILSNMLSPGTHKASLELILENERYFTPLKLELEFFGAPSIMAAVEAVNNTKINITETPEINNPIPINSVGITPKLIKREIKRETEDDRIMDNLEVLSRCKNSQAVCFEYSKRVLLREGYIPLNSGEVMTKLDSFCQQNFQKTFAEHSAKYRS